MNIPYFVLLLIYLVALGVYFFFAFFNIYHILRFGFFDFTGKLNTFLYLGVVTVIIVLTFIMVFNVPWFDTFSLDMDMISGSNNTTDL